MSIRALWIFTTAGAVSNSGKLLFTRTFPTVEKRAKKLESESYVAVPNGQELLEVVHRTVNVYSNTQDFVAERDACNIMDSKPIHAIELSTGILWPLLIIEHQSLLFCCLPLVEQGTKERPEIIDMPGFASGYNLLLGMIEFFGPVPKHIDETYGKLGDLYLFVGEAAPLGTPVDTNPSTVKMTLHGKYGTPKNKTQKLAAWRPVHHKGKAHIHITIKELIRVALFDKHTVPDMVDVYGSVSCKAELEGHLPEVTMTIAPEDSPGSSLLDHVITHSCVQSLEPQKPMNMSAGEDGTMRGCRLRFTPPIESFSLCHYAANYIQEPPIQGFYQMKGEKVVEVLVQLKLSDTAKNSFEYCEVQLPFHHRGTIISHESSPNHGSVLLSPDRKTIVWNIGQKFPTRNLEVLLKSKIIFGKYELPLPETGTQEEMFCIAQNCFAQLFFKVEGYTISRIAVEPKSIQISPTSKFKLTLEKELASGDYRIWNSHGEVPSAFTPTISLLNELQGLT